MGHCNFHRDGNIGEGGQSGRLRMSLIALTLSLGAVIGLVRLDVPVVFRLSVFVPFFIAAAGAYQGLFKTCFVAAAKGMRESAGGVDPVIDKDELEHLQRQGRRVVWSSALTAAVATLLVCVIP